LITNPTAHAAANLTLFQRALIPLRFQRFWSDLSVPRWGQNARVFAAKAGVFIQQKSRVAFMH
jgi:hypothetical protein